VIDKTVRGTVVRCDEAKGPDNWWERLPGSANARLEHHNTQMETDPEYCRTVRHVTKSIAARPGPLGKTVRTVVAVHALLTKAL